MDLSELSASELAKIDSVCLDYEANLRSGDPPSIDELVERQGGQYADLLRQELTAIHDELTRAPGPLAQSETWDGVSGASDGAFGAHRGSANVSTEDYSELPSSGAKLGPYVLGEMIGRGGMGVVFQAFDERLGRDVAIKMLTIEAAKRTELTERFEREAKAVAALSHPNIVELFDIGIRGGLPYAVMEYLDGELLDQRFSRAPMDAETARKLGSQVADALAAAHSGGVIHRDLKPHNIMLVRRQGGDSAVDVRSPDARRGAESTIVKLFDFGLSRVPRDDLDEALETAEGIILGTPGYMAPEQARGESVTPAADLFSLGCVLFEAFYGRRAFDGDSSAARFKATIDTIPEPDPIRRRDDVALADVIEHCLQKEPQDRPESAAAVARLLRQTASKPSARPGVDGRSAGTIARRRFMLMGGGALAGGLACLYHMTNTGGVPVIRSLAVLRFQDLSADDSSESETGPIGDRLMDDGEQFAAMLVHELSRLQGLTVPRFRSIAARTPEDFRQVGGDLGVDALLTGTIRTTEGTDANRLTVDFQLVSSETGLRLWGKEFDVESAENAVLQSRLASEVASAIGHRLTSTADELAPPDGESFRCLVDGKTRSDPESVAGLEMALKCFQHAHEVDSRFADPLAGIALTSITLAAQSSAEKSLELIAQSRQATFDALKRDPSSIDARLAAAMLDWQTTNRYAQAERVLHELSMVAANHWQVLHQYGLLQMSTGQMAKASTSLREASQLNPWSVLAKVDRARATWFSGNAERAIEEATRLRDKYDQSVLARGLLVDIFEGQKRFDLAAAEHDNFPFEPSMSESDYFQRRGQRLLELPYGPFGEVMNEAILQTRTEAGIDALGFAEIADSTPPMLPLLLAVHPSFGRVRSLERAKEILPS